MPAAPKPYEVGIDFGALPTFPGYQIRRAQARIFAEFETELGDLDLTPGAFGLLTLIHANPGITQMQLAGAFGIEKSTLTPVLNRLEKRRLVRRQQMASDRRYNALYVEEEKRAWLLAAFERLRRFEQRLASRLTTSEQTEMMRLIEKLQKAPPSQTMSGREPAGAPLAPS
jgi:DNA-binding MarR family transcriptional regulator